MARLEYQIVGDSTKLTAAIKQSVSGFTTLENSANKTTAAVNKEITSLGQLQKTLVQLNKDKLNIIDEGRLARQNKLIQELEAEIKRFGNIGKVGFDETGVAIEKASLNLFGMGKAATQGLSALRTIAYIVPGIGIAGIFNLAFDAITAATSAMGLFGKSAEQSAKELKAIEDIENDKFGKSGFIDSAVELANLTEKVKLAKGGFLDKNAVLKEYNDTLGRTVGQVKSLEEAEQAIVDKGPAYLKFLLYKAKAEYAFKKAAEDSYKLSVQQDKEQARKGTIVNDPNKFFGGNTGSLQDPEEPLIKPLESFLNKSNQTTKVVTDNIQKITNANTQAGAAAEYNSKRQISALTKQEQKSQQIAQRAFNDLERFAKEQGFNVFDVQGDKRGTGGESLFNSLNKQLDDILRKTKAFTEQSGLTGYALDVQKVKDKYIELNATLDENIRKTKDSKKLTGSEKAILEAKQTADRIALAKAQEKELYDTFNEFVVKALDKSKEKADKSIQIEQEARDKISAINEQAFANIGSKQETETEKIKLEWDKRKKAAQEYYNELIKLNNASTGKNDPLGFKNAIESLKIQRGQAATNSLNNKAAASQIENNFIEPFKRGIDQGLRKFATDFYSTLTDVDTYAKGTFGSIFADLTSKLTTSLNQVFLNVLVQGLADSLKNAIASGLSSLIKDGKITGVGIAAGAALGGAVVSSATPKTSTLGQAAGGALSGAGTGFLIGGPVGAVVGGVVGAISGIFGSASARKKQEELQKQQLEEAKKQTEYLRQQQVAYTSQIIGRMTANGTITGVSVGSQGQLVATVSGKDLQFVLDRNKNGR